MSERILRNRLAAAADRLDSLEAPAETGSVAILLQTKTETTYPTLKDLYIACSPLDVDGPEEEGAAGAFAADASRTIYALCLGPKVPPAGSRVIAHDVGGRWVFNYGD